MTFIIPKKALLKIETPELGEGKFIYAKPYSYYELSAEMNAKQIDEAFARELVSNLIKICFIDEAGTKPAFNSNDADRLGDNVSLVLRIRAARRRDAFGVGDSDIPLDETIEPSTA